MNWIWDETKEHLGLPQGFVPEQNYIYWEIIKCLSQRVICEVNALIFENLEECLAQNKHFVKLNIQKTKIMASGPITSWHIDGEIVDTVADFVFWGSEIAADGDCSHEIRRHLLLGRKVMSNLDSIFKSRDITLPTKVHLVKPMIFPVVMYGCESWTMKKAERQRTDMFEL